MPEEREPTFATRARLVSEARTAGHLDAVLSRREELLGLQPEQAERLAALLDVTRLASNECCTGG